VTPKTLPPGRSSFMHCLRTGTRGNRMNARSLTRQCGGQRQAVDAGWRPTLNVPEHVALILGEDEAEDDGDEDDALGRVDDDSGQGAL
jgi:hypothetical protein